MGRIALNMIIRNNAGSVRKALDSTKGAVDVYVVGFAGQSTDLTREATIGWLEEQGVEYVADEFDFVDFADARNRVLDLTPKDVDWILWMDADDFILGADELRGIVEACERDGVGCVQFPYIYHRDANGNPLAIHDRERLVRASLGWRWFRPVHETLNTVTPHQITRLNNLTWVHDHDVGYDTRSARNLALLHAYYESTPDDMRTLPYLGHAYFSMQDWVRAIEWFQQAYDTPVNDLEKWQAAIFLARSWFQLEEFENAIGWCWQAIDVEPRIADPYLALGACYVELGQYEKAYEYYQMANDKKRPPSILFVLPNEYTFNRWCYEHRAAAGIGNLEEALEICHKALEMSPGHIGFTYYSHGYREMLDTQRSKEALAHLVYHLQNRGDALTAVELLKYAPKNILDSDEYAALAEDANRRVEHVFDEGVFDRIYGSGVNVDETNMPMGWLFEYDCLIEPRFKAAFDIVAKHAARARERGERLTLVDLGCGDGMFTLRCAQELGCLVTGVDSIPGNILRAQQLAEKFGIADRTRFICAKIEELDPQEVGKHDVACCLEVIEHVANPSMVLGTGFDVADVIVFSTPHQQVGTERNHGPDGFHQYHVREFHFLDLLRLALSCGGRVEHLVTAYAPLQTKAPYGSTCPGYGTWVGEIVKGAKPLPAVVFYVGEGLNWSPDSLKEGGIGGSETAVIHMAKAFSKAGHLTFVYGPVDGVWDGVIYRHAKRFIPHNPAIGNPCALLISSRVPELFDERLGASMKALWLHDWDYGYNLPTGRFERLTQERAEEIDVIFVLSDAQRLYFEKQYPFLKGRLTVTANGIDPGRFVGLSEERVHHSFIWSSSPDRGLQRVLDMWPEIRKMWPDATLDVYYGFDVLLRVYGPGHPMRQLAQQWLALMERLDGVTFHGRINQDELAREFARHQFWFYPTSFMETYCIGAIEAMAAGCTPVTSDAGALKERVPERLRLSADAPDADYIKLLWAIDENWELGVGPDEIRAARETTWQRVFEQWNDVFDAVFEAKRNEHNAGKPKD